MSPGLRGALVLLGSLAVSVLWTLTFLILPVPESVMVVAALAVPLAWAALVRIVHTQRGYENRTALEMAVLAFVLSAGAIGLLTLGAFLQMG